MEMILIYYVMDFSKSQNYNYFKSPFKHKNWLFSWIIFYEKKLNSL